MKKIVLFLLALTFTATAALAAGGLDYFLGNLNVQARADMSGFAGRLSAQFGVPGVQVSATLGTVKEPADAFMIYQLGQMTHQPYQRVLQTYQSNRGKGWGVIARSLGIKPGSAEFHALKRGDFALTGRPGSTWEQRDDYGKGKGRGKGHNK
ncbi:hypothetical protein GeomeDRAFT_2564 [Geobacter metallireducens RCH3]|uniref:Uncharacterized protein n=1 Tax=Geobacter metallireducens (strain ATCC 53774 / DSM 7210 / GS-15) TaxID=269799 RepID=Q39X68_GEOMG|nr:hypothetical protein [Geobacter metallireducens]ABB31156.1 hypothetical protein Gmet_0914 [Geobacter metallireducens GS-15]EHP85334.1 hypothetical protein GeomeDRAFT_2564 [Geobacter metallireducens RCH3]